MSSAKNFLLPKLKSINSPKTKTISSHSNMVLTHKISQNLNICNPKHSQQALQLNKPSRSRSTNYAEGLSKFQYKYVNKSPEYFKKKQRSFHTLQPTPSKDTTPLQKFIGQKIKQINKQSLIDLARQGLYKNLDNKNRVVAKKKNALQIYYEMSPNNQTKYSTFNPPKIGQINHSLRKVYPSIILNP